MKTTIQLRVEFTPEEVRDALILYLKGFDRPAPPLNEGCSYTIIKDGAYLSWTDVVETKT